MDELAELAAAMKGLSQKVDLIARQRNYTQGTVVSIDTDAKTVEVQPEDSQAETITLVPHHGFLPKVGEKIMVNMNGADPFANTAQHMIEGDMQSREYIPGLSGWMIDAAGNAEFNDATIRGVLRTGAGETYIRIAYDVVTDSHTIVFEEAGVAAPAYIQRIDGAEFRSLVISGANSPSAPRIELLSGIEEPYETKTVFYGDVVIGGLTVNKPPMYWSSRSSAQSIPDDTFTTLTGRTLVKSNAPTTGTGSRVTPGRIGAWELTVNANWELNAVGNVRQLQLVNDTTTTSTDIDVTGPQGGLIFHSVTVPVNVTNAAHEYSIRVKQDSGGSLNIENVSWLWKHISD